MKKLVKKLKAKKHHDSRTIKPHSRFGTMLAIPIVIITAAAGVYALKSSFATGGFSSIVISVYSIDGNGANTGAIAGAYVEIASGHPIPYSSCASSAYSASNGVAIFNGCDADQPYILKNVTLAGYSWRPASTTPGVNFRSEISGSTILVSTPMLHIPPSINSFNASPTSVPYNGSTTLAWTTSNVTSCTGSGAANWNGPKTYSTTLGVSQALSSLKATTTFTLTCSGAGITVSKNVIVNVAAAPPGPVPAPTKPPTPPPTPPSSSSTKKNTSPTPKPPTTPPPPAPAIVKATTGDMTPPSRPENASGATDSDKATVTWSPATDNVGIAGYTVERSTDQLEWRVVAEKITDPKFEDLDTVKGIHYYYRVRALDAAGNQSEASFADIEIPVDEVASVQKSKAAVKNGGSSKAMLAVVGTLLVLGSLGGGAFWFNKRRVADSYDDEVRLNSFDNAINTTEPTSPHASESLKEMVMHDKDPKS